MGFENEISALINSRTTEEQVAIIYLNFMNHNQTYSEIERIPLPLALHLLQKFKEEADMLNK
jgi:hypothetical protein